MVVIILPALNSGGTEWQTLSLIRGLVKNRNVTLWVYNNIYTNSVYEHFKSLENVEIIFGKTPSAFLRIFKLKPKIVLSYCINYYWPEIIISIFCNCSLITERRNQYQWMSFVKRRVIQEGIRNYLTKFVICNSREVLNAAMRVEPNVVSKLNVIYNSNNLTNEVPAINLGDKIFSVSNIKKLKGIDKSIEVFKRIKENEFEKIENKLFIYGRLDSPEIFSQFEGSLLAEIYQGEKSSIDIYKDGFILLHLSESEGFPNVVLEAISLGILPILSNIPVHRELFSGCAIFVNDVESACKQIKILVELKKNNIKSYESMVEKCKYESRNYTIEKRIKQYERLLNECGN